MARSPFTLAAAVTAAVPGAEVVGARPLSSDGEARFDSAVATLGDGRHVAIRAAVDDEAAAELAAELLALRALTPGAREMLPFQVPEALGEARVGEDRALVTTLMPGFQVSAADIPAGRGAAEAVGTAIARIHGLPASVVRSAGLAERSSAQIREEIGALVDRAAATGRVSARLTVRWRQVVESDELWQFASTVVLGGAQDTSFLYEDDEQFGPRVVGVIGWHSLSIGDPAVDLAWLASAPEAATDVVRAYSATMLRAPDDALRVRARMLAELEFARWLLHGHEIHREDIVEDATELLDSLAEGIRNDDLVPRPGPPAGVDEAMVALKSVPERSSPVTDTSMQTDAYDPRRFVGVAGDGGGAETSFPDASPTLSAADSYETAPLEDELALLAADDAPQTRRPAEDDGSSSALSADEEEAQRAARAAFQRWKSSSSE